MQFAISKAGSFDKQDTEQLKTWFPADRDDKVEPGVFEIGLVLAGAVSAGSYTAGVIDFLVEALDAWEATKAARDDPDVPRHDVRLRVISGASAGGINGGLLAAICRTQFPHGPVKENPLYRAWVDDVDLDKLLSLTDLVGKDQPVSVLNSQSFNEIADNAIDYRGEKKTRLWLADGFHLWLTLTNVNGVPYNMKFAAGAKLGHEMHLHQDHLGFYVPGVTTPDQVAMSSNAPPARPDCIHLDAVNSTSDEGWQTLGVAALATAAFPLAFAPQTIERNPLDYEYRFRDLSAEDAIYHGVPFGEAGHDDERYKFQSVDGGVMNNEPFEIARSFLSGTEKRNPRDGHKANRAIIMVDPFSDIAVPNEPTGIALADVALQLLGAFKNQARFKPEDLARAQASKIYSRFLVAPSRRGLTKTYEGSAALATGGLGGFLGLLHPKFREHDFVLGRKNCRAFLEDWFVLPYPAEKPGEHSNPIFGDGRWSAKSLSGESRYRGDTTHRPNHFQIIPVMKELRGEERLPDWPATAFGGFASIELKVKRRVSAVYRLVREAFLNAKVKNRTSRAVGRAYINAGWRMSLQDRLMELASDKITSALKEMAEKPSAKPRQSNRTPRG